MPNNGLSNYKAPNYSKRFDYFDRWFAALRDHQRQAYAAALQSLIGQITSPCGTGKTLIQIAYIIGDMIRLTNEYEYGVYVIGSHRLSLNRQLLGNFLDVAINCGLPLDVLYVGSDRCDLPQYYVKYHHLGYKPEVSRLLATTNQKEIEQFAQVSRDSFRHLLIASTYDSLPRLQNIGTINRAVFDEAHNITENDFTDNINKVRPNIKDIKFFTATRRVSGLYMGMNDECFYGKVLYDFAPREAISKGEIVCPRLHLIDGEEYQNTNSSNTHMLVKNTIEAFHFHRLRVKEYSYQPDEIGAKLLVACGSIEEMERIYNDADMRAFVGSSMQFFAISSEGCYVNGKKMSKEGFFVVLNLLSDKEDAIIFNVDMLTEGIDLPSITGVMPLRNMSLTKLIQLLGRALRLHAMDRSSLYGGSLIPCAYKQYIKPYGHLVIPRHLASVSENRMMMDNVKVFYAEFGTKPEELFIQEKFIDHQPESLDTMIPYPFKDGKDYDLEHSEMSLVEEANLLLFKTEMENMTNQQKQAYLESILS